MTDTTADETVTVEIELDPARSLMYRKVRESAGDSVPVDGFLRESVTEAVQEMYDNRERIEQAVAAQREES